MLYTDYIKVARVFRKLLPLYFNTSTPLLRHKYEMFYFRDLHEYSVIEHRIVLIYTQFIRDLIEPHDTNNSTNMSRERYHKYRHAQEYLDACISFEDFCKLFHSSVLSKQQCYEIFHSICLSHISEEDKLHTKQEFITYNMFEGFLYKLDEHTFHEFMSCFYYSVNDFQQELHH